MHKSARINHKGFLLAHHFVGFQCLRAEEEEKAVYYNDFEVHGLVGIEKETVLTFGPLSVLRNHKSSGYSSKLGDLAWNELPKISFGLYLYDFWNGNISEPDRPNIWYLKIDAENVIVATFSNSPYLLYQSFPEEFPSFNNPVIGLSTSLIRLCHLAHLPYGTDSYQISKSMVHADSKMSFTHENRVTQTNIGNRTGNEGCSIGKIETFSLN